MTTGTGVSTTCVSMVRTMVRTTNKKLFAKPDKDNDDYRRPDGTWDAMAEAKASVDWDDY